VPFGPTEQRLGAVTSRGAQLRQGVLRTVLCADAVEWLAREPLPSRCHVITSPPDIGELKPRLAPAEYEEWFSHVVATICASVAPPNVAIFYVTDGRTSGVDGCWLDKSYLCTAGARAAGARCVWHKIVHATSPARPAKNTGRAGYVHLLCYSRGHRGGQLAGPDVLPARGFMAYPGAAGEAPMAAAVQYALHLSAAVPPEETSAEAASSSAAALPDAAAEDPPCATLLPEAFADAPPLIVDPFCGHGTVLAMANAYGCDAYGVDLNPNRADAAAARRPRPEDEPLHDSYGRRLGAMSYWTRVGKAHSTEEARVDTGLP
jgi:hypothetical protein